jgi:hypothetical protein
MTELVGNISKSSLNVRPAGHIQLNEVHLISAYCLHDLGTSVDVHVNDYNGRSTVDQPLCCRTTKSRAPSSHYCYFIL